MISGSSPEGGERGSTGSSANRGGGERAAERSILCKDGGANGVGERNSFVRGEKRPDASGASRTKTCVWTRGSQLLTLRGRPRGRPGAGSTDWNFCLNGRGRGERLRFGE